MAMKCEIDRLSALPDDILTRHIFSHLSLTDIIRTSLLSSRWQFVWKQTHHLNFSEEFFQTLKSTSESLPFNEYPQQEVKYINDIIDNILLLHSGHIEKFSIHPCFLESDMWTPEPDMLKALRVEQWVQYAALKGVKHMSLDNSSAISDSSTTLPSLPSSLFACHVLTDLAIEDFRFIGIPTEFDGFRSLQSLYLTSLFDTTDDGFRQLIGLCPLLRKLVLTRCSYLSNLKIQAPNLNSLKIAGCDELRSLSVDCPQLLELEIASCCCLFKFKICSFELFDDLHASNVQILKGHPMLNSLKKLSWKSSVRMSDLTLLTVLGSFCNLEEVHIETQTFGRGDPGQKRADVEAVADLSFPSLKKVHVDVSGMIEEEDAVVLAFLLYFSPSLNTITATLPYCPANIHDRKFINRVLDLQQIYEKVDIRMKIDKECVDTRCDLSKFFFPEDFSFPPGFKWY